MMEDNGSKSASAKEISANTSGADVDNALQYVKSLDATSQVHVDEAKLVRRIDWLIVPLMSTVYTLQFIDKILINYANVMGLEEDTHINGNQYSQLALIFYVSFLACELPTGFLMQRFPLAKYLGANVILWGVVISLTCIAKNWAALISLRVLLGVFESAVAPALILITSMWYKRSEQPARVGFWAVGSGVGTIIGALASFGFQHYSSNDFTSWQIMFLLFGLITIVVGVLVFFILPDSPMASRFSHEEKQVIIERIRENQTGIENKNFKFKQFFECLYDPQTWLLCLIMIADSVPNAAVTSFQATLIKGFGYTSKEAALLSIPSGTVSTLGVIGGGLCATKLGMRGPFVLATMLIGGVLGGCLLAFSPSTNQGALMTGIYLTNFIGPAVPLLYSYAAANYAGHTKKVTINAMMLISFCVGNIIGPLTFRSQDAPEYMPAKLAIIISCAVGSALTVLLMAYYKWENNRRDRRSGPTEVAAFQDITDRENKTFRYQL